MHVFRIYWACYSPKIQFSPLCLIKEMCLITSIAFLDVVFMWIVKQCVCIHFIWLFSPHFSPCVYFTMSLNVLQETRNLLNIACERNFTIIIEISDNKSYVKKLSDVNLPCFIILLIAAFPSYRTKTWRVFCSCCWEKWHSLSMFFRQLDNSNYVFIVEYMYLFVTLWQFNISYFSKKDHLV